MKTKNNTGKVSGSLTVERLKEFPGLETVSNEEAQEIIQSLDRLARILYSHLQNIKLYEHEKQHIDKVICERNSD